MELVGIQFSRWGAGFYVEASLADKGGVTVGDKLIPPKRLKHYHTMRRCRFGDQPFDYENEPVTVVASKATTVISDIEAWFAEQAKLTNGG